MTLAMKGGHTIGELAKSVGVPASTLRFYEREGLLVPDTRSPSGYRLYGPESSGRLRFIRSAAAAGFTLGDIRALLDFKDGATPPCREVQSLIQSRLAHVSVQVEHLRHVQDVLTKWLGVCRKAERTGRCRVIEGLRDSDEPECCRRKPKKGP